MLGINENREPVKAPFAKQMQEALMRFLTGNLTEEEKAQQKRDNAAAEKFNIEWK